ncbi:MAG: ferrous iron transporter B, partial [Chloroflexi bacterium]|nr:ferrous iron transporter B [Chloroflexota bacterium]
MELTNFRPEDVIKKAENLRNNLGSGFRDEIVKSLYTEAESIARRAVKTARDRKYDFDQQVDRLLTSPVVGLPIMLALLSLIIWLTVSGANVASDMIANLLFGLGDLGRSLFSQIGIPWWITGFIWDGVYLGLAWVVSVMLPPMAIFFPAFTFLEDLGYLPRVAFNLDWLFKKTGAHGKQALTMAMGFGCNAAGVVATRVIDSPRERLIAILTNNFVPCNGRFPTLIMLATVFVAAAFPPAWTSVVAAGSVVGVVLIGVVFTFLMSWMLSRSVLKGEATAFTLELPPYRRPNLSRIFYTSIIDRTIFVLWRAMQTAAPAGAIIWILANIPYGDSNLARAIADWLNPFGVLLGLDGVILLAYIIAIPANEIVVPTMMMVYLGVGM